MMAQRTVRWWLYGAMLLAMVLRLPLLWGEFFLDYDDGILIVNNPVIGDPSWGGLATLLSENFRSEGQNGMHLVNFLSMALFDGRYVGFMAVNLVYLCFIVYASFRFAGVFLKDERFQLAVAYSFAAHNLLTDTAAWMAARGHYLGLPFALMAFVFWDARLGTERRRFLTLSALAIGCGLIATFNKNFFLTVFPLLGWLDLSRGHISKRAAASWGGLLAGFVFFALWNPLYGGFFTNISGPKHPTFFGRLTLLGEHLYAMLVPQTTSVVLQHTLPNSLWDQQTAGLVVGFMPPALILVGLVSLGFSMAYLRLRHQRWEPLYLLSAMVIILLPSLTWRRIEPGLAFEYRYTIFPALCALTLLAVLFQMVHRIRGGAKGMLALVSIYVVVQAGYTVKQSLLLVDHEVYWQDCAERFPVTGICQAAAAFKAKRRGDQDTHLRYLHLQADQVTASGFLREMHAETDLANAYRDQKDPVKEQHYLELSLIRDAHKGKRRDRVKRRLQKLREANARR